MEESICIEDFCGHWRGCPVSFSSDYFPQEKLAYFTGDWGATIPPMPFDTVPTEADVYAWARKHGSDW